MSGNLRGKLLMILILMDCYFCDYTIQWILLMMCKFDESLITQWINFKFHEVIVLQVLMEKFSRYTTDCWYINNFCSQNSARGSFSEPIRPNLTLNTTQLNAWAADNFIIAVILFQLVILHTILLGISRGARLSAAHTLC